jgi:hypothetical protein
MSIIVMCRNCGTEFAPGHEAIVAGAWRLVPEGRPGDVRDDMSRQESD